MMEKISPDNFEAWLLDHSEGKLSAAELTALKAFAAAHPELEIDLEEVSLPALENGHESFDFKDSLRKTPEDILNEEVIAHLEGQLEPEQEADFQKRLGHDEALRTRLDVFRKTILKADQDEIYSGKSQLKKTGDIGLLQDQLIGYMEGQLDPETEKAFTFRLSKDPLLQKELDLILKTRLRADQTIVFPDKYQLKKRRRVIPLFPSGFLRIAAVLALVAGVATIITFRFAGVDKHLQGEAVADAPESRILDDRKQNHAVRVTKQEAGLEKSQNIAARPLKAAGKIFHSIKSDQKVEERNVVSEVQEVQNSEMRPPASLDTVNTEIQQPVAAVVTSETLEQLEELSWMEEAEEKVEPRKKGFIQKIASLAGKANKLGIRAVDGESGKDDSFKLSIFGYSVEKK
jgi:anti-sigma factor RsiW